MAGPVRTLIATRRRTAELGLGIVAILITVAGYLLLSLSKAPALPADFWGFLAFVVGLFFVAHVAIRRFAPNADPTLLPLVTLLNGIGFTMISRLDLAVGPGSRYARTQAVWIAIGIGVFVVALAAIRQVDTLRRYRYIFLVLGVGALLLPLVPGLGYTANGARLWIHLGPLNFQPGEAAKVLLVIFFAAYLADNRELLRSGTRRIGRLYLPAPRHFGPLLLPWATAVLIMVQQKDLGSSLLFFTVFVAMLYMATERSAYVIVGIVAFAAAAFIAYHSFSHVQLRVDTWLDPWKTAQSSGFQLVQSLFALGSGGISGSGLGLGRPDLIPNAATDFVFAAIGEELGLYGTVAIIITFLLFVGTGFRIAVQSSRSFPKLLAAGLTTIVGIQTFVIIGGVIRVIPLTGVTLPFVSYGGSSLIANFVLLAILLRISDETAIDAQGEVEAEMRLESAGVAS